jgi:hypothetical protein
MGTPLLGGGVGAAIGICGGGATVPGFAWPHCRHVVLLSSLISEHRSHIHIFRVASEPEKETLEPGDLDLPLPLSG